MCIVIKGTLHKSQKNSSVTPYLSKFLVIACVGEAIHGEGSVGLEKNCANNKRK